MTGDSRLNAGDVFGGEQKDHRDVIRSEFHFGRAGITMRMHFDGQIKFIDNDPGTLPELYDLKTDPKEITNLASEDGRGEQVDQLTAALRDWATGCDDGFAST